MFQQPLEGGSVTGSVRATASDRPRMVGRPFA